LVKAEFHDTDIDILARILADSPDTHPHEDVSVGVDVGVVECGLKRRDIMENELHYRSRKCYGEVANFPVKS